MALNLSSSGHVLTQGELGGTNDAGMTFRQRCLSYMLPTLSMYTNPHGRTRFSWVMLVHLVGIHMQFSVLETASLLHMLLCPWKRGTPSKRPTSLFSSMQAREPPLSWTMPRACTDCTTRKGRDQASGYVSVGHYAFLLVSSPSHDMRRSRNRNGVRHGEKIKGKLSAKPSRRIKVQSVQLSGNLLH